MSEEKHVINDLPIFGVDYTEDNILTAMEGCLARNDIRVSLDSWMGYGSADWAATPPLMKQKIYKSLMEDGWKDAAIRSMILLKYPYLSDTIADIILSELKGN